MPIALEELEALVGRPFPGGSYTIRPWQHWLMMDAVGGTRAHSGLANAIYVYYAAVAGMGVSYEELYQLVGATGEDGPMFGGMTLESFKPLEIGATYSVSGAITGVVRKEGRKTGVFDIVEFTLELRDGTGELVGTNANSLIFPRRD